MVTIKSYQKRPPQSNSSWPTRDYVEIVCPSSFSIKAVKVKEADINQITVFFPSRDNDEQGIALELGAPEAVSFGHALLAVALGNVDEITGHFQAD